MLKPVGEVIFSASLVLYKILFIYLLFLAVLSLCCSAWAFSSCGAQASHCSGFSCCGAQAVGRAGFSSVAHGLRSRDPWA